MSVIKRKQTDILFGGQFQVASSDVVSTTNSTTPLNKVSLVTPSLPIGSYRVAVNYEWNGSSTSQEFLSQVTYNAAIVRDHKQRPSSKQGTFGSTGSGQKYNSELVFYFTIVAPGIQTINLDWYSNNAGANASIWNSSIELWRVS